MNIVIVGVGGQGTILASKLLAQAAISEGLMVRTAETIGMAQRGGSVLGYLKIFSPDDPEAPLA
ncbi:MAG: 2-oxoacid:acceptor oxidoreductase family protein, partial [Actinomycetia bacterium]|nr:2-oxoacid:acceptor oxidoreductase family protein [Actinomycetes bacterium]